MNIGIGNEAAQFNFWEYINYIFSTVRYCCMFTECNCTYLELVVQGRKRYFTKNNTRSVYLDYIDPNRRVNFNLK